MSPEEKAARPPLQAMLPALKPALIFECVGVPGLMQQVFEGAPRDARIVVVGVCMESDRSEPMLGILKELNVQYVLGYTPEEFAWSLRLIAEGKVDAASLVTGRVGIDGVAQAFADLANPEAAHQDHRRAVAVSVNALDHQPRENRMITLTAKDVLPEDGTIGTLVGRVWLPDVAGPPSSRCAATACSTSARAFPLSARCARQDDPGRRACGRPRASGSAISKASSPTRRPTAATATKPWLLAPLDLQVLKAAGVTFAISMLERVIEERARGNPASADAIRKEVVRLVGDDLSKLKPGSAEAMKLKQVLIDQNAWSQYLEVGIGPDAEVFTKAPALSSVGTGMDAGLHPKSTWNNPEPEVVLVVSSRGSDRRRHARQRRQPARLRRPLGAAAVEGQGQQRLLRHRPVAAAVRQDASRSTTSARWTSASP